VLLLGVVYVSGLLGSYHGGMGSVSGVTRACSDSKCVCIVLIMVLSALGDLPRGGVCDSGEIKLVSRTWLEAS
jgi:hypothetical protein